MLLGRSIILHPRLIEQAGDRHDGGAPAVAGDRLARCFLHQVQLHRELADLALERRNLDLVLGNDAGLRLFIVQLAPIDLRQP